jgi:hypothetical protein
MHTDLDYEKLKRSFRFLVQRYVPTELVTPEANPIRVLERFEDKRPVMARRGLIVAIADIIEALQDLPAAKVSEIDQEMENCDAYRLSFLRTRLSRRKAARGD